jgi:nucleotide-binding universal stress UspA family protein
MSERILMPLDGSKLGEAAISYVAGLVARLAPEEHIEITLFHVITAVRHTLKIRGGGGVISVPFAEEELAEMKNKARDYLTKVSEGLQNDQITIICKIAVSENPADEIIKTEEEVNADLVAMSTHGRSGISRFAIGSVADKVLRGGSVPVLMVRAGEVQSDMESSR